MKTDAKMNQKKYIAGIDIGTTKIVAIIGSENQYGKLEILGYGKAKSQGIARGMVGNIGKTIDSIQQAVAQAQAKAGVTITEAYVGIAGQHIHSSEISDYIIRDYPDEMIDLRDLEQLQQRIRSMNKYPSEEILHILPQEYKVDEQDEIRDPEGMVGKRLDGLFHVVVGSQNSIKNIERCVKDAGIVLKGLTLEPLASANAVLSEDEKEMGIALIDIGGGTTDLAIFKDGYIRYTAVIPFGGNAIDRDIKTGCSILEKQAELVKIRFGSAWPASTRSNEIVNIPGLKGRDPKEISITTLAEIIKARMEEIIEAAKKARIHDFIMSLPKGYETDIGENGGLLSGGQRQRISIARAFLKDAPILILDEMTSNVDPVNESLIQDAITELAKNRTVIVIAHHLRTIQKADQILVFQKGKLLERGKHRELLEKDGYYARLWKAQYEV